MNLVDFLVIIALCGGTLVGFFRGLIRSVVNLLVLYLVSVVAAFSYPAIGSWLIHVFPGTSQQLRNADAFLFVLLLLYNTITLSLRPSLKDRFREPPFPGVFDKLGGLVVGFFLTSIWIGLALMLAQFLLSVPWVNMEGIRVVLARLVATSATGGLFRGLLPYAVLALKPWFAPFGGLPDVFIIR
jgi:uncharacterized membrane protein required for colicin V production